MEWLDILQQIIEVCVIPALGVLLSYLTSKIITKLEQDKKATEAEIAEKYLAQLNEIIIACVKSTNQTYVNVLKEAGSFDAAAQKIALNRTTEAVLSLLSEKAEQCLTPLIGDLKTYVVETIEANIEKAKITE